jgi:hypothetical protein
MFNDIRDLNDIDLTEVSGGMTCLDAYRLANLLLACSIGLAVAGNKAASDHWAEVANGAVLGGCP